MWCNGSTGDCGSPGQGSIPCLGPSYHLDVQDRQAILGQAFSREYRVKRVGEIPCLGPF